MTPYIALLRGINVAGKNKLPMAELKTLSRGLELNAVETYIQSGNMVFTAGVGAATIAAWLKGAIQDQFGYDVPVQVWSAADWDIMKTANPFAGDKYLDAAHLHVTLLEKGVDEAQATGVLATINTTDRFHVIGRAVYLFCPQGYGRTKLTNGVIEKKLGTSATTRNWRTVGILGDMVSALA